MCSLLPGKLSAGMIPDPLVGYVFSELVLGDRR